MGRSELYRVIAAIFGAAGAGAISIALGSSYLAALPAVIAGGVAAWLLMNDRSGPILELPEYADPFEAARPVLPSLMEAFTDPLLLTERRQVTMANRAALDLLGQHIVGEDVRLAIRHPAAAERLTGTVDGAGSDERVSLVGIGDADRHWELRVHDLNEDRKLVLLSDYTSRYVAERMRVDFVANASHELRTPLATLIGFIETLEDGKAAEDRATRERFLGIMSNEARRMQRLIDDLISLSRIEAEKFSPPDTAVAIGPLITEVVRTIHAGLKNEGDGRIEIEPAPDGLQVKGDRAQLSQLLHNLIGNALKYGRQDRPVRISAEPAGDGMVMIMVADEGEGIAAEHLPRLTERFYRVDASRSRAMGGTGLGLAIVKHIVERHRGRLDIRSKVSTGTIVSVLLPSAPASLS